MESGKRRSDQAADDPVGRFVRLDAREIYAGAGAVSLRAGGVSAAVSRGIDLPRALHGELVPALPDGDQRFGGCAQRARRKFVVHTLSRCGRWIGRGGGGISSGGNYAAGNDVGRYGCGGASGGRALPAIGGRARAAAADES